MKTTKKKSNFRGRVATNAKKKPNRKGGSKYLTLPEGVSLLSFDESVRKVKMDFMAYEVTDKNHPDHEEATVGSLWYRRPFLLHKNIGADNQKYVCRKSIGGKCPICEFQKELFDTDKEAAIKLYPQQRYLYAPVPLDSKKHDQIPYVWDQAESLFQDCLDTELDENDENEIFPDPEEGLTLALTLKWKTIGDKGTPFPETRAIKFEERENSYDEDFLETVPNLDECLNILSYEDLKTAFFELNEDTDEDNNDDEDEDEKPRKKTTAKAPVKKRPVEDDDEEEEEEEDEKPVRKSTTAKKPIKKRPVEEDEDEEEDDEDEKPPVKLTKLAKNVDEEDRCVACVGSGKDSRGRECPICKGTGLKPKKKTSRKIDEEDEEEETKPVKKGTMTRNTKTAGKSDGKNKCPHGYKFGVDTDKKKECDACDIWNDCIDEKESK